MASRPEDLRERTKKFALRVIRLFRALPRSGDAQVIGRQLLRSGTSIAANYRAACRARSRQEFAARVGIVMEEADETVFWLELISESGMLPTVRLEPLLRESRELAAISRRPTELLAVSDQLHNYPITQLHTHEVF